ncbi:MAG: hypothetical protein A2X05_05515 [Bacteroidetes bacterium GWE2_41_25]|nr:MAG: hypothetical protein A2X03_12605 [Bacteroidetes bacterium GWA2_40_15]OFX83764.1 MAG: hypothetical protein A2X06_13385 [Bacteroidetes bacterium GWC2_40_22]OFY03082.1 MAG: hypothetical protein A2X05_05515 [Bacteroidetes bacterium GWE2_41_25]OFY60052.1 MAG: hypothetical protein A2X04_07965 [Bacteroidetes bacterium GWF2_41_9]HAM09218.1 hypothetical protein [Bacteroidales bacterium]
MHKFFIRLFSRKDFEVHTELDTFVSVTIKINYVSEIMQIILLIFFVYPGPKGSEENQFTPPGDGVNKLIFKRF